VIWKGLVVVVAMVVPVVVEVDVMLKTDEKTDDGWEDSLYLVYGKEGVGIGVES